MSLKKLKGMLTAHMAQITIFERSGRYVDSCNSLVNYSQLEGKSIFNHLPMLQSMEPALSTMQIKDAPIYIPAVEENQGDHSFILDYHIYNHPDNEDFLVLLAMDYTRMYEKLRGLQQERNELLMKTEVDIPNV